MRLRNQKPASIPDRALSRGTICFFGASISISTARAQYRFENWTADSGLQQNSVRAILSL